MPHRVPGPSPHTHILGCAKEAGRTAGGGNGATASVTRISHGFCLTAHTSDGQQPRGVVSRDEMVRGGTGEGSGRRQYHTLTSTTRAGTRCSDMSRFRRHVGHCRTAQALMLRHMSHCCQTDRGAGPKRYKESGHGGKGTRGGGTTSLGAECVCVGGGGGEGRITSQSRTHSMRWGLVTTGGAC
jgi:hypothetical protein